MGQYIFTPPAASYDLPFTVEALSAYISKGRSTHNYFDARKIGTTLTVIRINEFRIDIKLYDTVIAHIEQSGTVEIPDEINRYGSNATTYWVQKALRDNGHHDWVARENFEYAVAGKTFLA